MAILRTSPRVPTRGCAPGCFRSAFAALRWADIPRETETQAFNPLKVKMDNARSIGLSFRVATSSNSWLVFLLPRRILSYGRVGIEERMAQSLRSTVIVHGRLATREVRLAAARARSHGLQIMTFEQLATRLAGGLSEAVDTDTLRSSIQACMPETELGELDPIKSLPGMVSAAAETLRKSWRCWNRPSGPR